MPMMVMTTSNSTKVKPRLLSVLPPAHGTPPPLQASLPTRPRLAHTFILSNFRKEIQCFGQEFGTIYPPGQNSRNERLEFPGGFCDNIR